MSFRDYYGPEVQSSNGPGQDTQSYFYYYAAPSSPPLNHIPIPHEEKPYQQGFYSAPYPPPQQHPVPVDKPSNSYTILFLLTCCSLVLPGLILLILLSGPNSVPQFHYAQIWLSRAAVDTRADINDTLHPVTDPLANVFVLYLDSVCTTTANPYEFARLSNRTIVPDYDVDYYHNLTCSTKSLGTFFNFESEFALDHSCVESYQAKVRSRTKTSVRLYLAASVIYCLLLVYHALLWLPLAKAWVKSRLVRLLQIVLAGVGLVLVGVARQALDLHVPLSTGLRRCFTNTNNTVGQSQGSLEVKQSGVALTVCGWALILLGVLLIVAQLFMLCYTDGRKQIPRHERRRYNRRGGDGGGGGGGGSYGGDGGGGCGGDGGGGGGGGGDGGGC